MSIEGGVYNHSMIRGAAHIMIVARGGALYQSLAQTLEERLRGCQALICEAGATVAETDEKIRLILIHTGSSVGLAHEIEVLRDLHADAAIALLVDDVKMLTPDCDRLFTSGVILGVVPMTLKLEVWLSAVLLLLNGGEYYPAKSCFEVPRGQRSAAPVPSASEVARSTPAMATSAAPQPQEALPALSDHSALPGPLALPGLTAREQEILELVSEGHQNKLIAHKMSLSEHTVKVHVHNLLSKLRVSNRTQAAATYRRSLATSLAVSRGASVSASSSAAGS